MGSDREDVPPPDDLSPAGRARVLVGKIRVLAEAADGCADRARDPTVPLPTRTLEALFAVHHETRATRLLLQETLITLTEPRPSATVTVTRGGIHPQPE